MDTNGNNTRNKGTRNRPAALAGDPLVAVLAAMIKSALAWEAEHGAPPPVEPKAVQPLIKMGPSFRLASPEIAPGGKCNDNDNNSKKYEPPADL